MIDPQLNERLNNIECMLKQLLAQESEWVELEVAAGLCHLKPRTLYNYRDQGKMREVESRLNGKKVEFRREDLHRWNESRISRTRV
jgi:hypothetical protein